MRAQHEAAVGTMSISVSKQGIAWWQEAVVAVVQGLEHRVLTGMERGPNRKSSDHPGGRHCAAEERRTAPTACSAAQRAQHAKRAPTFARMSARQATSSPASARRACWLMRRAFLLVCGGGDAAGLCACLLFICSCFTCNTLREQGTSICGSQGDPKLRPLALPPPSSSHFL